MPRPIRLLLLGAALTAAVSHAEDEHATRVREELERQLHQMVGTSPTRVRVDFVALDEPNYALEGAAFELDGKPLLAPALSQLGQEGKHLVWNGDVKPGKHALHAHVVYANTASIVVSDEGSRKWKVSGEVAFEVNAGIEVQVQVVPTRDPSQRDISKRVSLSLPAKPVMVAQLDDGKMPEPASAPPPTTPEPPVLVASNDEPSPKQKPRPPRSSDGPPASPKGPVRGLDEALGLPATRPAPEGGAAPETPMARAVEPVDAGVATLSVERPVAEEQSGPWWLIGGAIGASLALAVLIYVARRRARPPSLDE